MLASPKPIAWQGQAGAGAVEGSWQPPASERVAADGKACVGLICHPHPLQQGSMHNKVVTTIARAWRDIGVASLRFNFRGVGASAGSFADGEGECADLLQLIATLRSEHGDFHLLLAGFSFGAYVASLASLQSEARLLLLIAPPVGRAGYAFPERLPSACPHVVVAATEDELVDNNNTRAWQQRQSNGHYLEITGGHFFHGRLPELRSLAQRYAEQYCFGR